MNPMMAAGLLSFALVCPSSHAAAQAPGRTGWDSVGTILRTPAVFGGGYYRYNFPRRDLTLRLGDVTVSPALALGGWAGFSGDPGDATMMGDLVLVSAEVKPVLAELARQGLDATAVHNHLVGETPTITYVHIHGQGSAIDLATKLDRVIVLTGTPRPVVPAAPAPLTIDTALVFKVLGRSGRAQGGVAQVSFMLVADSVRLHGRTLVPALAYGSPVNIQMVSPERAVATGDFAVTDEHVAPLVRALAAHGIVATAVHSHLIGESPTIRYIHFWADGPPGDVLAGLRAAIDSGTRH